MVNLATANIKRIIYTTVTIFPFVCLSTIFWTTRTSELASSITLWSGISDNQICTRLILFSYKFTNSFYNGSFNVHYSQKAIFWIFIYQYYITYAPKGLPLNNSFMIYYITFTKTYHSIFYFFSLTIFIDIFTFYYTFYNYKFDKSSSF